MKWGEVESYMIIFGFILIFGFTIAIIFFGFIISSSSSLPHHHLYQEYFEYSTVRLPQKNVSINTSPEFMTCCDCTDDCINKEKCACWQMTIQVCSKSRRVQK